MGKSRNEEEARSPNKIIRIPFLKVAVFFGALKINSAPPVKSSK